MLEMVESACAFLMMLMSAMAGWGVQRALSDHHRTRESIDSVRLVITMLVTFSALVLGLLTSGAKDRFDEESHALTRYSVSIIELDQRMREFGPGTAAIRAELRAYVAAAVADTWPDEPAPGGVYPRFPASDPSTIENRALGVMLAGIQKRVDALPAGDPWQQSAGARVRTHMERMLDQRWLLMSSAVSTMSFPFLAMLLFWMVIIFAAFGLTSPRNPTLYVTLVLCALLIASSLYVILDFDSPRSGFIHLSSTPLRNALAHIDAAE